MIDNNIPYFKKNTSTLPLLLSAAILMLLTTPIILFNILQPVQAQIPASFQTAQQPAAADDGSISFRTPTPASGKLDSGEAATITFDAQGTRSSSNPQHVDITSGTLQVIYSHGGENITYSGRINSGTFTNNSLYGKLDMLGVSVDNSYVSFDIFPWCSTGPGNPIGLLGTSPNSPVPSGSFHGAVECTLGEGDTTTHTTQQSSSSSTTGTTTQDRDSNRDGDGD